MATKLKKHPKAPKATASLEVWENYKCSYYCSSQKESSCNCISEKDQRKKSKVTN